MAKVTLDAAAAEQFLDLPERIKGRVTAIIERLKNWPQVSGARPLRGELAGHFRIRTGDYRMQFRVSSEDVIIERVGHRDGFYD